MSRKDDTIKNFKASNFSSCRVGPIYLYIYIGLPNKCFVICWIDKMTELTL